MRSYDFSVSVPSKWVFAGEHAVLRGGKALAIPHDEFNLEWRFARSNNSDLVISRNPFRDQLLALLKRGGLWIEEHLQIEVPPIFGEISVESTIPLGAGLGSSAALCVAAAEFLLWQSSQKDNQNTFVQNRHILPKLATALEDLFHGKSSGMDVNVIVEGRPILFSMEQKVEKRLEMIHLPRFKLFDTGFRATTKLCISRVEDWRKTHSFPEELDARMSQAACLAVDSLRQEVSADKRLELCAHALSEAQGCFEAWGLVTPELLEQKKALLTQGALSAKLTGAGLGGFWVTLWKDS